MPNASYEYEFVEQNRTFHSLPTNTSAGSAFKTSSALGGGKQLHWSDLTLEFRVVVLFEISTPTSS